MNKNIIKIMNKTIIGKQYCSNSSALRAIKNFEKRNKTNLFFWANRIEEGCYEINAASLK